MTINWQANYKNGTSLRQNGRDVTYADIDREQLASFDLWDKDKLVVRVDLSEDANGDIGPRRLIWRSRGLVNTKGKNVRVHLVGWQRKVSGRNIQSICYVSEDGPIILAGQWQENQPMMHAVRPLPCESDLAA
jgi:hypothetical protein